MTGLPNHWVVRGAGSNPVLLVPFIFVLINYLLNLPTKSACTYTLNAKITASNTNLHQISLAICKCVTKHWWSHTPRCLDARPAKVFIVEPDLYIIDGGSLSPDHIGNNFASASYSWFNAETVAVAIQLFTAYPPCELTSTQISALLPRPRLRHLETQWTDGLQLVDVKLNHYKKLVTWLALPTTLCAPPVSSFIS